MSQVFSAREGDTIALPWGEIELHNNEVHIRSNVADPPGVSFHGYGDCKSLGKVSFKMDGKETVLIQGKRTEDGSGEVYLGVLDANILQQTGSLDRAMVEAVNITARGIEFRVPVGFSAGVTRGGVVTTPSGAVDTMWAPDGLSFTQQQTDQNFVTYVVTSPYDKGANPRAIWSALTGKL